MWNWIKSLFKKNKLPEYYCSKCHREAKIVNQVLQKSCSHNVPVLTNLEAVAKGVGTFAE